MLNMFVVQGVVLGTEFITTQAQKNILDLGLKTTGDFGNEHVLTLKSFGDLAVAINNTQIKKGSAVTISGQVSTYNGELQLIMKEVHFKGESIKGWGNKTSKEQIAAQAPVTTPGAVPEKAKTTESIGL